MRVKIILSIKKLYYKDFILNYFFIPVYSRIGCLCRYSLFAEYGTFSPVASATDSGLLWDERAGASRRYIAFGLSLLTL
jgi:hypothetical protein